MQGCVRHGSTKLLALGLTALLMAHAVGVPTGPARAEAAVEAFVTGTEDLPLMAGLRQSPDHGVVFDSAQGRIIEAYAAGYVDAEAVRRFYTASLPQLGWQEMAGPLTFRREGEILTLEVTEQGAAAPDTTTVRFRIAPAR